jgi:hypothetical protein
MFEAAGTGCPKTCSKPAKAGALPKGCLVSIVFLSVLPVAGITVGMWW